MKEKYKREIVRDREREKMNKREVRERSNDRTSPSSAFFKCIFLYSNILKLSC